MEQRLFGKYTKVLLQRKSIVVEIIEYIKKETGVEILEEEIELQKGIITFRVSSVKKQVLHSKKIQEYLQKKKYRAQ